MNIHVIIFAAFLLGVSVYLYKERKNFDRHGIIFLRRTKKFVREIDNIYRANPVMWKRLSVVFILIGFSGMFYGIYWLGSSTAKMFETGKPALSILLPSPSGEFSMGRGYVLIPLWLWLVGISLIAIPHELMHGIMARVYRIRLKSVGIAFLGPVPGAFVEPDENQLEKSGIVAKLSILSAGSSANIIIGLLFILLAMLVMKLAYMPYGVEYSALINGTSAAEQNLSGIIIRVDGTRVYDVDMLAKILSNTSVNDTIRVETTSGNYTLRMKVIDGRPIMGIYGARTYYRPRYPYPWFWDFLVKTLGWLAMMEIGVGIANLLPMKPFDGGLMLEAVEKRLGGNGRISSIMSIAVFLLIISGFLLPRIVGI